MLKNNRDICNTVKIKKPTKFPERPQITTPCVDEVLDILGGGSFFLQFDLVSGFA